MALNGLNNNIDFAFGEKLLSADMNVIRQQAADHKVGSNLSADANQTISLANGTTYRTTMTLTAVRVIALPSAPGANARCYLKLTHASGGNNMEVRVDNGSYTGTLVLTIGGSGTVEGWAEFYWDGSTWRTGPTSARTGLTFTVAQ